MDIRKIKKLIELLEESGISELEITEGEESVRISRNGPAQHFAPQMQHLPRYVTRAERGQGFAELAQALLQRHALGPTPSA